MNRGQALYLKVYDASNTYQRWQAYYINQTITFDSVTWDYHPFTVDAFVGGGSGTNSELVLNVPATKAAVDTFNYALAFNWLCEVKLYEFNVYATQVGPPSGQVLIAAVTGEVTGISGSFTSLDVTLGSGMAPIGAQAPPRKYTTGLVGTPLRL